MPAVEEVEHIVLHALQMLLVEQEVVALEEEVHRLTLKMELTTLAVEAEEILHLKIMVMVALEVQV